MCEWGVHVCMGPSQVNGGTTKGTVKLKNVWCHCHPGFASSLFCKWSPIITNQFSPILPSPNPSIHCKAVHLPAQNLQLFLFCYNSIGWSCNGFPALEALGDRASTTLALRSGGCLVQDSVLSTSMPASKPGSATYHMWGHQQVMKALGSSVSSSVKCGW